MNVLVSYDHRADDLAVLPVEELVAFVLNEEGCPENSEVSVSFVDDDAIAALNEEYRGKTGPTDVLSFECDGDDEGWMPLGDEAPFELGDVIIAPDVAQRQTDLYGTSFEGEITLLLVHGLLHLCGYDHIDDDEADEMEARERAVLGAWADAGHEEMRHLRDDTIRARGEH